MNKGNDYVNINLNNDEGDDNDKMRIIIGNQIRILMISSQQ